MGRISQAHHHLLTCRSHSATTTRGRAAGIRPPTDRRTVHLSIFAMATDFLVETGISLAMDGGIVDGTPIAKNGSIEWVAMH